MRESSRTAEPGMPFSAIALTGLFMVLALVLILFFMQPVEHAARGFGLGPTPTLAAPIVPNQ